MERGIRARDQDRDKRTVAYYPHRIEVLNSPLWPTSLWGLAAFGQPGVEAVLEMLRRELKTIMRQAGTTSVDKITRSYLVVRPS